MKKLPLLAINATLLWCAGTAVYADQLFNDDLITSGSLCVGFDCSTGENFGFDTIRLKENNIRIKFDDTSASSSFPSNDWQITINDSANGGTNHFAVEDITNSKVPFYISAGASNNAIYVHSNGRVGLGTSAPGLDLEVKTGNSPGLRLNQDGTSGFTAQAWDVAGNETNFFVRDVTNGSKIPFKIRPGAPNNSLYVDTDGDIGLGTSTPDAKLDIEGQNISALISDTASPGSADVRTLLTLNSAYGSNIKFTNRSNVGRDWTIGPYSSGNGFLISRADTTDANTDPYDNFNLLLNDNIFIIRNMAATELMRLTNTQLVVNGTVVSSSSKTVKDNIVPVDPSDILSSLSNLTISKWNYINDGDSVSHIGPIAEDFYQVFGLGSDDKHIASLDTSGIALAAIQALNEELKAKDSKIESLETQNKMLSDRLTLIEQSLEKLSAQ